MMDNEERSQFSSSGDYWDAQLTAAEKVFRDWNNECAEILKIYLQEKAQMGVERNYGKNMEGMFNILWSNIQIMLPAIYSQPPIPVVKRRFRDSDPVARLASEILERALSTELETDERKGKGLHDVLLSAGLELLLKSRATTWQRYEPEFAVDEAGMEVVVSETAPVDFVAGSDFLHCPKSTWAENVTSGWVARKVMLTREEGIRRFGDVFRKIDLNRDDNSDDNGEMLKTTNVWEIWDAATKTVIWMIREPTVVLEEKQDMLNLDGFFPCPRPAYATVSTENLIPVPEYRQYRTLAELLDRQTRRISGLVKELRVAGLYDKTMGDIGNLLTKEGNVLIGIDGLTQLAGKGSGGGNTLMGVVQYLPIDVIAKTLVALYEARERTKQTLYEVSGIADIMRGVVDPREKLGQSELKHSNASTRIEIRRKNMEILARDILRQKAEIIAEHYSPNTIRQISSYDQLPQIVELKKKGMVMEVETLFAEAIKLLKGDRMRGFRVEVETGTTVMMNDQQEKAKRIEFLQALGAFIEQAMPAAERYPQMLPLFGQMMLFGTRGFRIGRQLEMALEETISMMEKLPQQNNEQNEQQQTQQKHQMELQKGQMDLEGKKMDIMGKQAEFQQKGQLAQVEGNMKLQEIQMEMEKMRLGFQSELMKLQADMEKVTAQRDLLRDKAMVEAAKPAPIPPVQGRETLI